MVVIWWSPNHTSNYLPKLRWGNHSTVKCSKSNFLKQSFNTTAFSAIYLLLMSECSSMAQGGEKGESIEDLVCFFFNKISTSISFGSIIGSLTHFLGLWWSAFVPTSTILLLNFPGNFDWITSSGDLGNEGGAWSAGAWVLFLKLFLIHFLLSSFSCVYNTPLFLSAVQKSVWKCQNMQKRERKSGF